MDRCTICHTTLRPDDTPRTCCWPCEHRMRATLRELALQLPLLQTSLQRGDSPTEGRIGAATVGRSPLRDDVLNLLGPAITAASVRDPYGDQDGPPSIASVLYGWADVIATEHCCDAPALRPGGTWTTWLTAYLPWAAEQDWVAELDAELAETLTRVRAITRTEPRRRPLDAPCVCGAFGLVAEDWVEYIECEACGRLYTEAEYQDHRAEVMPHLLRTAIRIVTNATATEAACRSVRSA